MIDWRSEPDPKDQPDSRKKEWACNEIKDEMAVPIPDSLYSSLQNCRPDIQEAFDVLVIAFSGIFSAWKGTRYDFRFMKDGNVVLSLVPKTKFVIVELRVDICNHDQSSPLLPEIIAASAGYPGKWMCGRVNDVNAAFALLHAFGLAQPFPLAKPNDQKSIKVESAPEKDSSHGFIEGERGCGIGCAAILVICGLLVIFFSWKAAQPQENVPAERIYRDKSNQIIYRQDVTVETSFDSGLLIFGCLVGLTLIFGGIGVYSKFRIGTDVIKRESNREIGSARHQRPFARAVRRLVRDFKRSRRLY